MSTLAIIILVVAALIAALLIFAATRPDHFRVARSIEINAPAEAVFPLINSQREFNRWNPFLAGDPKVKLDYSGPDIGPGSICAWDGNNKVGKGSAAIVAAEAGRRVAVRLDMVKPMACQNSVEFALTPAGAGTKVTWTMDGAQPFIGKLFSVFINCDRMVGGEFEKGLGKLKALTEK